MSHHPTTAELAAFRRSIYCDHLSHYPGACRTLDGMHPDSGAYPSELRDGIGRITPGAAHQTLSGVRREASALRSRAYARMDYCACQHPDRHYGNLPCRVTPESSGIPLGPNGYCWSCWSAKHDQTIPTDTWTEDEPHSPLPIRYQPSFIITR